MTTDTPDNTDAVLRISHSDAGYGIIARKRVWAINHGRLPTVEDYHAALVQCLKDKADEIERLRLTDAEREAVAWAVSAAENCQHPADDALRGLLDLLSS